MITDIKKILTELSYRVRDGSPDFENEQHLIKLYDILKEYQWPADARIELLKTLTEVGEQHFYPQTKLPYIEGIGYKSKEDALKTLEIVSSRSDKNEIIETLMNRAEFHDIQTQGMRDAHEVFKGYLTEEDVKPHADSELIKKLGANKLSVEVINGIINGDYPDSPLSGAGSTYNVGKKKYTYDDIKKALSKQPDKKLFLTTAGTVIKIRSQFGERICHMNVSTSNKPKETYMGQISILYKTSKLSGVEVKDRVAPGIGYEKMQVENLDTHMTAMLKMSDHLPLQLFIGGKDTGVDIDGGVKVPGSPKADLAFGKKGKPNFFVSYKHGDYVDLSGKELKPSYQQYGSLKTFYTKEFNSAFEGNIIGTSTDKFLDAVSLQKDFTSFKDMTDVSVDDKGFIVIYQGKKKTTTKWTQKIELWKPTRFKRVKNVLKKKSKIDAYFMDKSGWAVKRDLSKVPGGQDISLLSIFGKEYAGGKGTVNNCHVLMQDSAAFEVQLMTDAEGVATGVNIVVSNKGHLMWNPKIYGGSGKFPKFADGYKPYLVARYTGEMDIGWNNGSKIIFGARLLVMPKAQAKGKKDI